MLGIHVFYLLNIIFLFSLRLIWQHTWYCTRKQFTKVFLIYTITDFCVGVGGYFFFLLSLPFFQKSQYFGTDYVVICFFQTLFILFLLTLHWQLSTLIMIKKWYQLINYRYRMLLKKLININSLFLVHFIFVLFIFLFLTTSYIEFFVLFEIIGVTVYVFLSVRQTKESMIIVLRYFFFGFFSSTCMVWGVSLLDARIINIVGKNTSENLSFFTNLGLFFILISFFIKLGAWPFHWWVVPLYRIVSHTNVFFMLMLVNSGFLYALLKILHFLPATHIVHLLLNTSALFSTLVGSLKLCTQFTTRGFLGSMSIVNSGFILLSYSCYIYISGYYWAKIGLLWLIVYYIFIYNLSVYFFFTVWGSLNWFQFLNLQQKNPKFYQNMFLSRYRQSWVYFLRHINVAWLSRFLKSNLQRRYYNETYIIYRIRYIFPAYPQIIVNLDIFNNIKHLIVQFYADYAFYIFIWILWGFPPTLLFVLKFYISFYMLYTGFLYTILLVFLISNFFVTMGLIRILTFSTLTLKYTVWK